MPGSGISKWHEDRLQPLKAGLPTLSSLCQLWHGPGKPLGSQRAGAEMARPPIHGGEQLPCPGEAGLGGGHGCCDKQFLSIFLAPVPLTHGCGSRAVSPPRRSRPVSLLHSEPRECSVPRVHLSLLVAWDQRALPPSANRRRIRTWRVERPQTHQRTHCA